LSYSSFISPRDLQAKLRWPIALKLFHMIRILVCFTMKVPKYTSCNWFRALLPVWTGTLHSGHITLAKTG